jgi:hypothetical protein
MRPEGLTWLGDACLSGGHMQRSVSYEPCVDMWFAEHVIQETPAALEDATGPETLYQGGGVF